MTGSAGMMVWRAHAEVLMINHLSVLLVLVLVLVLETFILPSCAKDKDELRVRVEGVGGCRLVRLFGVGNSHPQDCGSNPKTRSS